MTVGKLEQKPDDLNHAISLLTTHQTITQTIDMAQSYCEKARKELQKFPESPARDALFDLVDFCANRAY